MLNVFKQLYSTKTLFVYFKMQSARKKLLLIQAMNYSFQALYRGLHICCTSFFLLSKRRQEPLAEPLLAIAAILLRSSVSDSRQLFALVEYMFVPAADKMPANK